MIFCIIDISPYLAIRGFTLSNKRGGGVFSFVRFIWSDGSCQTFSFLFRSRSTDPGASTSGRKNWRRKNPLAKPNKDMWLNVETQPRDHRQLRETENKQLPSDPRGHFLECKKRRKEGMEGGRKTACSYTVIPLHGYLTNLCSVFLQFSVCTKFIHVWNKLLVLLLLCPDHQITGHKKKVSDFISLGTYLCWLLGHGNLVWTLLELLCPEFPQSSDLQWQSIDACAKLSKS